MSFKYSGTPDETKGNVSAFILKDGVNTISISTPYVTPEAILTAKYTGNPWMYFYPIDGDVVTYDLQVVDITLIEQSLGITINTVSDYKSLFPKDYYETCPLTLLSAHVNEVVEQGKNLIDLEHFKNYSNWKLDSHTGSGTPTNSGNKGYDLPCKPNVNYTISKPSNYTTNYLYLCKENADGTTKLIGYLTSNTNQNDNITFSISDGETAYIRSGNTTNESIFNDGIGSIEWIQLEKSSSVTPYSPYHKTTFAIPEAITQLDGYGLGITDDVCNYVDWENRTYHQMVGSVDLGTLEWKVHPEGFIYAVNTGLPAMNVNSQTEVLNAIISNGYTVTYQNNWNSIDKCIACFYSSDTVNKNCIIVHDTSYTDAAVFKTAMSGVMLYYELATEIVTDISDLVGDIFQNPFEVEAGGTLTFKNSNGDDYRIPVPNEEEYLIALAEVTA